ncbi:GNAT family N-acetyltransferase [Chloroflexota bacterium]
MSYQVTQESFDSLTALWKSPQSKLRWSSVFVLPPWLKTWWQSFQPAADLLLLSVREGKDILGIAPLMREKNQASFVGDTDVCDYMDFIITPGRETEFCTVILDELNQRGITNLTLEHLRPDASVMGTLVPLSRQRQYQVQCQEDDVSLEVNLPDSWDNYLDLLDKKQRHEVRRKLRRLWEAGDVSYRCEEKDSGDIDPGMDTFLQLFARSEEEKAGFMTPTREVFFREMARVMAEQKMLRLGTLEIDDKVTAMILGFAYDQTFYLYNSAYNPDYRHLSVGIFSKALCIKENIKRGMKKWDFLKGAEVYKYHLGGTPIPLYRCEIQTK